MERATYNIIVILVIFSGVQASRKKGVGVNPHLYKCGDMAQLDNIAWWYDWGANLDLITDKSSGCDLKQYAGNYVPMVWGYDPSWFNNYQDFYLEPNTSFVLAYNEPNHNYQSGLTAQEAVDAWPIVVESHANGRVVVSPAAARCGANCLTTLSTDWFDEFFSILCQSETKNPCRVTYLATHIYQNKCKPDRVMTELEALYQKYGLKIWLTEFACPYEATIGGQLAFMQTLLPLLEEADYVYRYAWYVHRATPTNFIPEAANLFEMDSSTLTQLGEYYNAFTVDEPTTTTVTPAPTTETPKPTAEPALPGVCLRRNTKK